MTNEELLAEITRLATHWEHAAKTRDKMFFYDPKAEQMKVCAAEVRAVIKKAKGEKP